MPAPSRISETALAELRARNPVADVAAKWVRLRHHGRKRMIGPCPMCSPDRQSATATRFECSDEDWVCAVCCDGGDCIKLVRLVEGLDFLKAVDWLGGARDVSEERAKELAAERAKKQAQREREADAFRDRERRTLWDIWLAAAELVGSPAEQYLRLRGLEAPDRVKLRCVLEMPYFVERAKGQREIVHRGPAMVAPILRPDGHFGGLHFTYLDVADPKGKARIKDPHTGEELPAKKSRGSKKGGYIELWRGSPGPPRGILPTQLIMGEGIEKVLAVWRALHQVGRDLIPTAWRTSVDLGNLGGRAASSLPHPSLKTEKGRPQRVPGPVPDLEAPGIPIPDSVTDVVLLGDSTSDRFTTQCALARAAARFVRDGRTVRVAWAPEGVDFDDMLREAA